MEVGDLAEAVRFYEGGVGLPVRLRFDEMGLALLQHGDQTPGLGITAVNEVWDPARTELGRL